MNKEKKEDTHKSEEKQKKKKVKQKKNRMKTRLIGSCISIDI